jgi:hypothetical protein
MTRTQKPFVATLRVNESRPAELGQKPEASLAWGGVSLTAKRTAEADIQLSQKQTSNFRGAEQKQTPTFPQLSRRNLQKHAEADIQLSFAEPSADEPIRQPAFSEINPNQLIRVFDSRRP